MELYFDTVTAAFSIDKELLNDGPIAEMLFVLINYYEGGQWLADFQADEQGMLPHDLKRGILSEDGFYNFLTELDN